MQSIISVLHRWFLPVRGERIRLDGEGAALCLTHDDHLGVEFGAPQREEGVGLLLERGIPTFGDQMLVHRPGDRCLRPVEGWGKGAQGSRTAGTSVGSRGEQGCEGSDLATERGAGRPVPHRPRPETTHSVGRRAQTHGRGLEGISQHEHGVRVAGDRLQHHCTPPISERPTPTSVST